MILNKKFTELSTMLEKSLLKHDYVDSDDNIFDNLPFQKIIKTERKFGVRYLCAVIEIPDNILTDSDFGDFFGLIRNTLTKKYARFPYLKELGTYLVILCDNSVYGNLRDKNKLFIDRTGLHMNTKLGTCIINKDTLDYNNSVTWGLFHSGKHFDSILKTISEWSKKEQNKLISTAPSH